MPESTCLVTGGAGFIGCALSSGLAELFDRVVAFDSLHPQVHAVAERPASLDDRVELVHGDVTVAADWDTLLAHLSPTVVIHLAAETGTAQSLTEASRHAVGNVVGTTRLLDALVRHAMRPERVVLTSSRAVYGEGAWVDAQGLTVYPGQRDAAMLGASRWDFARLRPLPVESSRTIPSPTSVYGATKLAQEHVLRAWCAAEGVRPVVFRLQNVYGPGQSLTNPHTGVVSFFARTARSGGVIAVFEDGRVVRDFVFVDDVVAALLRGVLVDGPFDRAFDIGSGGPTTILDVARLVAEHFGAPAPQVTGGFRHGDVRSASCDIGWAGATLGWVPEVTLRSGLVRLCEWLDTQPG